ncbi:hypothetical protein BVC80_1487g3 [Macleaya cordata]|uniref:Reverse transcriptase zinc-binding domain n=1 Tax=Macleaya cordata TaxID=56857 RepID=A0A200QNN8_MACCD|nr:hypothetical protein BVC80_1487g3 [Macleaya cordata]
MAWRIFHMPDSPLFGLLKAKYFKNSSFWDAPSAANATWFWKSIVKGRDVLKGGIRWQVGNVNDIHFWQDPWVQNIPLSTCIDLPHHTMANLLVKDIMDKDTCTWNLTCVAGALLEFLCDAIISIPVPCSNLNHDKIIWASDPSDEVLKHAMYQAEDYWKHMGYYKNQKDANKVEFPIS